MIQCCPTCNRPLPTEPDGLTPTQRKIFRMVSESGEVHSERLYAALFSGTRADPKGIDVHIHQLNKRLRPRGLVIRRRLPRNRYEPWILAPIAEAAE